MFEDSYRRAYDAVSPPQELVADVIAQAREGKSALQENTHWEQTGTKGSVYCSCGSAVHCDGSSGLRGEYSGIL